MNATATVTPVHDQRFTLADELELAEARVEDERPAQYMRALERANEVRIARAELKRRVATGALDAAEVVLSCPWEVESMAIGDLLVSQRRWGQMRVRKLLAQVPVSERKTIGSLTERQRRTLAGLLAAGGSRARGERRGVGVGRGGRTALVA
jgi:hypothetical protein